MWSELSESFKFYDLLQLEIFLKGEGKRYLFCFWTFCKEARNGLVADPLPGYHSRVKSFNNKPKIIFEVTLNTSVKNRLSILDLPMYVSSHALVIRIGRSLCVLDNKDIHITPNTFVYGKTLFVHGSGGSGGGVPDCRVAMESCTINDWVLIKVNSRDFCLGNIIEPIKSDGGVLGKTILITDHYEGIYLLILYYYFPNMQCRSLIQLLNGFFESVQWVTDYLYYYNFFSYNFKHFISL